MDDTGVVAGAGALFFDDEGHVLIVEPTYRATWEIPDGRIRATETPRTACARILREALGTDLPFGRLLVVDWLRREGEDRLRFVFDGGELGDAQFEAIEMDPHELESWASVPPDELFVMLAPDMWRRVMAALEARADGTTRYLENGSPVA